MAQISYVTPDGWIQHDDTESFSAVTPSGWLQFQSAVQPPAFTAATLKLGTGTGFVTPVVKVWNGSGWVVSSVKVA